MRTRPFHNEPAPFCESLAKYAVAFFKMSRSSRRTQFSFFNRFNSSNSAGVISTPPDLRSRATRTHLSIVLFPTPISKAACLMLKPRSSTSFTASTLYSSLYLCFPMTFPSLKRSITKPLHFCPVFWGRFRVLAQESLMTEEQMKKSLKALPEQIDYLGFKIMPKPIPQDCKLTLPYIDHMLNFLAKETVDYGQ